MHVECTPELSAPKCPHNTHLFGKYESVHSTGQVHVVTVFNGRQNPPIPNYRASVVAANVTASMMTPLAYSGRNTDPRKPLEDKI